MNIIPAPNALPQRPRRAALSMSLALLVFQGVGPCAGAQEVSYSGYGTLGYARSNRDEAYQRWIDRGGSFQRDSLVGVQADLKLSPRWSATVQMQAAPAENGDNRWVLRPAWAFVAWRPNDDWLLRAGRLKLPMYLYFEAMDVGQTHDMARLPAEVYSLAPSAAVDGLSATRNWMLGNSGDRELSADFYLGRHTTSVRFWTLAAGDGQPVQPYYLDMHSRFSGMALTLRQPGLIVRGSLHRARTGLPDGGQIPLSYPFVPLGPGIGYYQVDNRIPGPGVPTADAVSNLISSLGVELEVGQGWRVAGEWVRNRQRDTELAADSNGWYLAVFRRIGAMTPYASVARLGSRSLAYDWYDRLTQHPLPATVPGAAELNFAQRSAAGGILLSDQRTLALGAAYALSPALKLKGEWSRVHIGRISRLVDPTPEGEPLHDTSVDVLSINLNFVF